MPRRTYQGPDREWERSRTRHDENPWEREPRGDYVCTDCGSDRIEPRRMRTSDRSPDREEHPRRRGNPRDYAYDHRYDDTDSYRGGDWGREDVYPYSRSAMSGYEEPWHRGRERERDYENRSYGEQSQHHEFDEFARDERAFRDERELDYRLRERDHYDVRDDDRWRR